MRNSPLSGRFDAYRYVFGAMPTKAQARLGEYPFSAIAQLTAFLIKSGVRDFSEHLANGRDVRKRPGNPTLKPL